MRHNVRNQTPAALDRAKSFRKSPSRSEAALWELVRGSRTGFKFRRQVPVGPYVLDFYCAEAALCVEADGEQHDTFRDELRDRWLADRGIETLRFPTLDFWDSSAVMRGIWLERIVAACEARSGRLRDEAPQSGFANPAEK